VGGETVKVEPPRKVGEPVRKKTTMGVYNETKAKLGGLAKRWSTTLQEATRYLVDVGQTGLVDPDVSEENIEAQVVALIDALDEQKVTVQETKERILILVRLRSQK
jgi:hypothetical protein